MKPAPIVYIAGQLGVDRSSLGLVLEFVTRRGRGYAEQSWREEKLSQTARAAQYATLSITTRHSLVPQRPPPSAVAASRRRYRQIRTHKSQRSCNRESRPGQWPLSCSGSTCPFTNR